MRGSIIYLSWSPCNSSQQLHGPGHVHHECSHRQVRLGQRNFRDYHLYTEFLHGAGVFSIFAPRVQTSDNLYEFGWNYFGEGSFNCQKFSNLLNYVFLIFVWGALVGASLISYKMVRQILIPIFSDLFGLENSSSIKIVEICLVLFLATISLPVTLKNHVSSRFSTILNFALIFIFYVIILLFIQMFSYRKHYVYTHNPRFSMFRWDVIDMFKYYGNILFGFNVSAGVFPMISLLKKKNDSRHIGKIYLTVSLALISIFLSVGIIGYASLGNDSPDFDLIILRPALPGSKDIPMKIGLILMGLTNLVNFMVYVIPWKSQFFGFFEIRKTRRNNVLVTLFVVYVPFLVGWLYPYATKIFGIFGSFFGTMLMMTFPGILYVTHLKREDKKWTLKSVAIMIWCLFSTLLGFISGTMLILELFHII